MDYTSFGDLHLNRAIGDYFVRQERLTPADLDRAISHQEILGGRLDTVLLDLGLISESALLEGLGILNRSPTVSGAELEFILPVVARLVAPRMAVRYKIVPFRLQGKKLAVASLARGDVLMEDELRMLTGCMVTTHVALEVRLFEALAGTYGFERTPLLRNLCRRLRTLSRAPQTKPRQAPPPTSIKAPALPSPTEAPLPRQAPPPSTAPEEHECFSQAEFQLEPVELDSLELTGEELASLSLAPPGEDQLDGSPDPLLSPRPIPEIPDMTGGDHEQQEQEASQAETSAHQSPPPATMTAGHSSRVITAEERREMSPDELLAEAAEVLKNAEMREDIGDAILGFCTTYFRRRMLLVRRGETIMGWRGEGEGVDQLAVRAISIPVAEPSVFMGLGETINFWMGPLPPMPRNIDIVFGLGSDHPKDCMILPVVVKNRPVCFLYGDNLEQGTGSVPMATVRRLVVKAGLAFQVYILKNKIHVA